MTGMTIVLDTGTPTAFFEDLIASHGTLIDAVKFGWGTALVTADFERKARCLNARSIDWFLGGTVFEWAVEHEELASMLAYCRRHACRCLEISNGIIALEDARKCEYIRELASEFRVFSEVGFKNEQRCALLQPADWVRLIEAELIAGAEKVVLEARQSGTQGICTADGRLRVEVIEAVEASSIDLNRVVFEAPTQALQVSLITRIGSQVNLSNIAPDDIVNLATLRLGLRYETLRTDSTAGR